MRRRRGLVAEVINNYAAEAVTVLAADVSINVSSAAIRLGPVPGRLLRDTSLAAVQHVPRGGAMGQKWRCPPGQRRLETRPYNRRHAVFWPIFCCTAALTLSSKNPFSVFEFVINSFTATPPQVTQP